MRIVLIVVLLALTGCATAPRNISNACAIFQQRDGLFNNWERSARSASREYGVPVPILMATIYVESGFRPYARPPRRYILGFIPWGRVSSAYGYSQALDGTWDHYRRATGRWSARRTNFSDAVHFVAWYHNYNHQQNGIALNDPYNLYLAYYSGHAGYARGTWRNDPGVRNAAAKATSIARNYSKQLRSCR
ncbi:hypothetical protein BJF93_10895 [Xaviernesmea oryzae]|uniref:Transglycosylase SLT domain-containing protein n=1 Tax=Xaviernesmea oryzae TaxID=464029 RepID=A0A1Q9AXB8_9HYPH|nr:transglycosylase SLT domain-containing protein [Xaviernesmea oryzae]OLP60071.1 hypothetical protein BJF93_10895 [Xaviernesmea oryzae]SEK37758.1 hypothetical protein SAMN04487976_10232 [Xaviernesmea oryzae]